MPEAIAGLSATADFLLRLVEAALDEGTRRLERGDTDPLCIDALLPYPPQVGCLERTRLGTVQLQMPQEAEDGFGREPGSLRSADDHATMVGVRHVHRMPDKLCRPVGPCRIRERLAYQPIRVFGPEQAVPAVGEAGVVPV